jgi:hypothetical protein
MFKGEKASTYTFGAGELAPEQAPATK